MIYLPACFIIILFMIFQFITDSGIKGNPSAFFRNQYGEMYLLQPIMCIGGSYAEINILDSEMEVKGDVPNIVEIRYENEDYIIKNMDEDCGLTIKRGTRFLSVKPETEIILRNKDAVTVSYGTLSIAYEFSRG